VGNGRERDIGSPYGAPRDGGERDHHGIDIFAPRGTPAVAVSEAIVTRVQTTARGGNVVWLRDARGNRLYYAHLDHQAVAEGMRVLPGDTIGYVGNTGNARTTPPHLHFGVYRRGEGPVDPYWFVYRPGGALPRLVADTTRLGTWSRTPNERTLLRAAPDPEAQPVMPLARHTPLRIIAAVGSWYRVRLPDGVTGYVGSRLTEPLERAVRTATGDEPRQLLARPIEAPRPQDVIAEVSPGEPVSVLAYYGGFALVRARDGGGWGWIEREGDQQ
jgi:SH3-like domain-containing protein